MRTVSRLTALALVGALTLSGCTPEQPAETATTDAPSEQPADGDATATDGATTGVIGVDFPDPDAVIADATFTRPGTEDEVRVGIESLTVRDGHTELRLVFTPLFGDGPVSVFSMMGDTTGIDLLDRRHLKSYWSGHTSDFTSSKAAQGESVGFQVFFAAPEDDIEVIDVQVNDSWPAFEDVPLTFED